MIRRAIVLAAMLVIACGSPAASPGPNPLPTGAPATPTPSTRGSASAQPASPTPIPLPTFAQLSAPSGAVLWTLVAGSRLFRSTDRGATWTERATPAQFANPEIAFISEAVGFVSLGGTPAAQCAQQSIGLSHTIDGGTTWQTITPTGIVAAQCKEALSFADAQRGFLSAWDPNSAALIYRTTDGGRTWSPSRPLPDPPGFTTSNAGFTLRAGAVKAFGDELLVEAVGQTTGGQRRYIFSSSDGGATWTYRTDAPDPDSQVVFVTASRWFQLSAGAVPRETADAGASWHAFTTDYQQAAPLAPAIVFGDAQTGYATARGAIQRTIDAGAHWTAMKTPGT